MTADNHGGRARMPADIDAPDRVVYGLSFRQLAILAVAAVLAYGGWSALHTLLPLAVLAAIGIVLGAVTFALAVGRRDGLPMDQWLLSAVRHHRGPHALTTFDPGADDLSEWVDVPAGKVALPAPLRLPADAISDDGQINLGDGGSVALVAAGTVNLALRTDAEQEALVDSFAGWLNSLSSPTQIVVAAQPVDLASHAAALQQRAAGLPHPALADAAADHAEFLADLAQRRDPLRRQVLVTTRADTAAGPAARRQADDTARALAALGVPARALDASSAVAALAAAADPFRPPRPGGQAAPDQVITIRPPRTRKTRT